MSDKIRIIQRIERRIGGCFGSADGIFAGHPNDENHAKELRELAYTNGLSLGQVVEIANTYMQEKGYHSDHRYEQINEIRRFFGKKLR